MSFSMAGSKYSMLLGFKFSLALSSLRVFTGDTLLDFTAAMVEGACVRNVSELSSASYAFVISLGLFCGVKTNKTGDMADGGEFPRSSSPGVIELIF
jgi:hypothetical protein